MSEKDEGTLQMTVDEPMEGTSQEKPNLEGAPTTQQQSPVSGQQRSTTEMSATARSMQALFEQQESMANPSWADLMEQEATKSSTFESESVGIAEVVESKPEATKNEEEECVTLSSDDEYPSLSAAQQSDVGCRKYKKSRKKRGEKTKFQRSLELTEALASQVLKAKGQVPGKSSRRRAVKRGKTEEEPMLSAAGTEDEEGQSSSKQRKRRRKGARKARSVSESSDTKFGSKDLPLGGTERASREGSPGSSASTTSIASTLHIKEGWAEPKLGWCRDEPVLVRRTREIERAKEKPVYARYLAKVPRHARKKGMPRTPNKYIQYSRRSWDKQVRIWKRQLYEWAGEEPSRSCLSLNESSTSEETLESGERGSAPSALISDDENRPSLDEIKVESDAAASLLGHLEIDTQSNTLTMRGDDESTLKGTSRNVLGPRDFSQL